MITKWLQHKNLILGVEPGILSTHIFLVVVCVMDLVICLRLWRRWIIPLCVVLYFFGLAVAIPLCVIELQRIGAPQHVLAWFIGGIFVMLAVPIVLWEILQHVIHYTRPYLQRHIIRILWMVPIYAVNAWFALRFPDVAIYLDTVRECYEAYAIYNFMRYLLNFLESEHPHFELVLENKPPVKHVVPMCCFQPWPPGEKFLKRCKHGTLQYTVVRPAMTILALVTEWAGVYGDGDFSFKNTWSYIVIINNISQGLAMYCLVLFYKGAREELQPVRPLAKFLCVKAVVFMSFWQSTVIAVLTKLDVIPQNGTWVFYHSIHDVALGLQNFLICIEMFVCAVALAHAFSHHPFVDNGAVHDDCFKSFLSMWDVRDVGEDVVDHARYLGRGARKQASRALLRGKTDATERTPLLAAAGSSVTQDQSGFSYANRPPTPPVVVELPTNRQGASDTPSLFEAEWERSGESFFIQSATSSMNNYLEFSNSGEEARDSLQPPCGDGGSREVSVGCAAGADNMPGMDSGARGERGKQTDRQKEEHADDHHKTETNAVNKQDFDKEMQKV